MTSIRRTASLLVVLAMLMTMTALPAFAVASANATITTGDLFSGQSGQVQVKLQNTATPGVIGGVGAGSTINAFTIEVPQQVVDVVSVTLPANWDGGYDDEIGFVFATAKDTDGDGKPNGGLAPGGTLNVDFNVKADAIANDRTGRFVTSVSDNGGLTLSEAGAPTVTSRILEILSTAVAKPAGASNPNPAQVTTDQDNATFQVLVRNYSTADRSVTADVVRTAGTTVTTTPKTETVPAGGQKTIEITSKFGPVGTLNSQATAVAGASSAKVVPLAAITVQAKFAANYVNNTLSPRAVAQNTTSNVSFTINKTAGAQPVAGAATFLIDGTAVQFDHDGDENQTPVPPSPTPRKTSIDQSFDAANGQKAVTFPNGKIPNLANGDYPTSSVLTGVDGNGATVAVTLDPGQITLDNLLPVVTITANVGEPDVPGATPATTNGRTITFSGSIGLNQGTGACTNCTVTKAVLVALPSNTELPLNLTNASGTLSGSQSFTFPPGTTTAVAKVTARRNTGAQATGTGNVILVDLIAPKLANPGLTGREPSNDVIFIDLLDDGLLHDVEVSRATDWLVDNNTVVDVVGLPTEGSATSLKLVLQSRLGDNDTPTVTYAARPLVSTRIHDRVSLTVADQAIDTRDGIIPATPVIESVAGLPRQPDEFWTNDSTPDVALSGLVAGNLLEIYYDIDGDGAELSERKFVGSIESSSQTFTLGDLGNVGRAGTLIARMKDTAGNIGLPDTDILNLDFTPATIVDFTVSGNQVTVIFDEPVARGRNAAFDWTVNVTDGAGVTASRTVTSVAVGSDLKQRVLTVSSSSWDGTGTVKATRFKFRGAEADRYQDRATNTFADTNFEKLP